MVVHWLTEENLSAETAHFRILAFSSWVLLGRSHSFNLPSPTVMMKSLSMYVLYVVSFMKLDGPWGCFDRYWLYKS
ncbi:hypothetical protein BDW72DRAFT_175737 [Aspergillus terricola var. indicus]